MGSRLDMRQTIAYASLAALLLAVAGCGGGATHPPVQQVRGKVLLGDTPVSGAEVSFVPKGDTGKAARGKTDAQGQYQLKTYFGPDADVPGAVAGDYQVTVQKIPEASGIVDPYKQPSAVPKNELPADYADPAKSKLSATVAPGGKNEFDFQLK